MDRESTSDIDSDVFTAILAHVYDLDTVHAVLQALPKNHPYYIPAITRLLHLPLHINYYSGPNSDITKTLDIFLSDDKQDLPVQLTDTIQHLVIDPDSGSNLESSSPERNMAAQKRLSRFIERLHNLRIVDWGEPSGSINDHLDVLKKAPSLGHLSLMCDPLGGGFGRTDGDQLDYDPNELCRTVGPSLKSLALHMINSCLYRALLGLKPVFFSYHALKTLFVDVTVGVWDWDGAGSPQEGATNDFVFQDLGFPSLVDFTVRVSDLTISGSNPGPLAMINSKKLENLTLIVSPCFSWASTRRIKVFEGISASDYPFLRSLQIIDTRRDGSKWYWTAVEERVGMYKEEARCYWGLVPSFLASIETGQLQHLTQLWVDQDTLMMPKNTHSDAWDGCDTTTYTVTELWDFAGDNDEQNGRKKAWVSVLKAVFRQLESLRVGLGPMKANEVQLILGCCDAQKLSQFGFEWKWELSSRDQHISSDLLKLFEPFIKLTDLHILYPRPGTGLIWRSDLLDTNRATIEDIEAIFESIPSLCRVGWGLVTIWERNCCPSSWIRPGTSSRVIQVIDINTWNRIYEEKQLPEFYRQLVTDYYGDNMKDDGFHPRMDSSSGEIKQLRTLLERTLPKAKAAVED